MGEIRTGGPDGPVVGEGFVEMINLPIPANLPYQDLDKEDLLMDFSKINR